VDAESLGGARTHTEISGVAHYLVPDDAACCEKIRHLVARLPRGREARPREAPRADAERSAPGAPPRRHDHAGALDVSHRSAAEHIVSAAHGAPPPYGQSTPTAADASQHGDAPRGKSSRGDPDALYDLLPGDHRMSYDMHQVLRAIVDDGALEEFQENLAREMICADASIHDIPVGVIANQRGLVKGRAGERPRFGGIVYAESAEKVAYFIDRCDRQGLPILFVQDVSGFMVGPEAEHEGIIRAGARFVEAMATASVPKLVLTVNHASGAGYYAMAGQGFDPDFIFSWPTGRMAVMEGESAVQAVFGPQLEAAKRTGGALPDDVARAVEDMRADYEHQLDARYAGARGYIDAIVYPEETRDVLAMALRATLHNAGPHIGPFVLPPHLEEFR
jgi:acetyl-CoA carboxylase carboxyltransferase component